MPPDPELFPLPLSRLLDARLFSFFLPCSPAFRFCSLLPPWFGIFVLLGWRTTVHSAGVRAQTQPKGNVPRSRCFIAATLHHSSFTPQRRCKNGKHFHVICVQDRLSDSNPSGDAGLQNRSTTGQSSIWGDTDQRAAIKPRWVKPSLSSDLAVRGTAPFRAARGQVDRSSRNQEEYDHACRNQADSRPISRWTEEAKALSFWLKCRRCAIVGSTRTAQWAPRKCLPAKEKYAEHDASGTD